MSKINLWKIYMSKYVCQNFVVERQSTTAVWNFHNLLAASSTPMSLITRDTSRRESSCGPGGQRQNYEQKKIKVGTSIAIFLFCFPVSSSFPASSTVSEGWSYSSSDVRTRNERSCKTFRLENLFLVVELFSFFSFDCFRITWVVHLSQRWWLSWDCGGRRLYVGLLAVNKIVKQLRMAEKGLC